MNTPGPDAVFHEQDLPATIRLGHIPRWLGSVVGALVLLAILAGIAAAIAVNARDSSVIGNGAVVAITLVAIFGGVFGGMLWWFSGVWVTLTADEAVITKAYVFHRRVPRAQLEDYAPYLHTYSTRSGVQYRMIPTFTVTDAYGRLRDIPLQFLSWNPKGIQGSQPTPRAVYLDDWAKAGTSPYAYAVRAGAMPPAIAEHRQKVRSAIRRRTLIIAGAYATVGVVALVFGVAVAGTQVWRLVRADVGGGHVDAQSDRIGIRDLSDSLTPVFHQYRYTEQPEAAGTSAVTFFPGFTTMPPAGYTLDYFVRDPAQRSGSGLSSEERKYGEIVSRGTLTAPGESVEFALEHGDTTFTFELYVTDASGHTSRDANMFRDLGGPEAPQTLQPAPTTP